MRNGKEYTVVVLPDPRDNNNCFAKKVPLLEYGELVKKFRYQLLLEVEKKFSNCREYLCNYADVTSAGLRYYIKSEANRQAKIASDLDMVDKIKAYFKEIGYDNLGYKQIAIGMNENSKYIYRITYEYMLQSTTRRSKALRKAHELRQEQAPENLLNREFHEGKPFEKISADITEGVMGDGNKVYLAAVRDNVTNEVLAVLLSLCIDANLVCNALKLCLERHGHRFTKSTIMHTDRGSQYTSSEYTNLATDSGLRVSLSRTGQCWDNASIESFFGILKDHVTFKNLKNIEHAREVINHFINYYNYQRKQKGLGNRTPYEFRLAMESGEVESRLIYSKKKAAEPTQTEVETEEPTQTKVVADPQAQTEIVAVSV